MAQGYHDVRELGGSKPVKINKDISQNQQCHMGFSDNNKDVLKQNQVLFAVTMFQDWF